MKALVYTSAQNLAYRDEPDPVLPDGECMVRVEAVGICGSDMHAYLGHDERRPAPLILGHEAAGVVVQGPNQGRRVTVNPLATCGQCRACRTGRNNLCGKRQILSMAPRQGLSPNSSPFRRKILSNCRIMFPSSRPVWLNRWPAAGTGSGSAIRRSTSHCPEPAAW